MDRTPSPTLLRGLLATLATIASLLALKALIWPRWPAVTPLDRQAIAERLRSHGFEAGPAASLPARRSYERATSEVPGFAIGEGQTLRLMRGSARERFNLQIAYLGRADPALTLKDRRIMTSSPPPSALGLNGSGQVRQTCLVSGSGSAGGFGVTRSQLLDLVDQLPVERGQKLQVLLGSRLPRDYSCVLISVSAKPGTEAIGQERWQRLLDALRPALTDQRGKH